MANNANSKNDSGRKTLPPALNPESPALVQPYKEFVARGWISKITLEVRPLSIECGVYVAGSINLEKSKIAVSAAEAKALIIAAGVWSPKGTKTAAGQKVVALKPKRTLVLEDFKGNADALKERALAVAKELTDQKARGRIGSLNLMIDGADTFEKWWLQAKGTDKVRLFVDEKHLKTLQPVHTEKLIQVLGADCPFRGPVPTPKAEDQEEEDEETTAEAEAKGNHLRKK